MAQIFQFILEGIPIAPLHLGTIYTLDGKIILRRTMGSNKDLGKGTTSQLFATNIRLIEPTGSLYDR
jgi:hypothetical protein